MEMMGQENMIRDEMGPVFTPMAQSLVQPLSLPDLHYSAVTRKHVDYVEAGKRNPYRNRANKCDCRTASHTKEKKR